MKKKSSKKLPPKKLPKKAAKPQVEDDEEIPGDPDDAEGDEGMGEDEEDYSSPDDEEDGDLDQDEEGEEEDPEEGGEEGEEDQHELSEDRLIAVMERTLQQLEQLQAQQHMMHGGGMHPALSIAANAHAPTPVPGAPAGGLPPQDQGGGMGGPMPQGGGQDPRMAMLLKQAMGGS